MGFTAPKLGLLAAILIAALIHILRWTPAPAVRHIDFETGGVRFRIPEVLVSRSTYAGPEDDEVRLALDVVDLYADDPAVVATARTKPLEPWISIIIEDSGVPPLQQYENVMRHYDVLEGPEQLDGHTRLVVEPKFIQRAIEVHGEAMRPRWPLRDEVYVWPDMDGVPVWFKCALGDHRPNNYCTARTSFRGLDIQYSFPRWLLDEHWSVQAKVIGALQGFVADAR